MITKKQFLISIKFYEYMKCANNNLTKLYPLILYNLSISKNQELPP